MATKLTSAETWQKRYDLAVNRQERMFRKFSDYYDSMYAHVNASQYALWRSKVFIPIIPSKAWSMIAKMQQYKPGFEVGLYGEALLDEAAQDKADKAQWKLEHDWDNPYFDESMSEKLFSPLVDAAVTGTGIAKLPWCFSDKTRYEKLINKTTGEIDITKDVKIQTGTGYNELIPHDILGCFIAPGAKNLYSAPWVVLEDWATFDQLNDENTAAGGHLYKNLDRVKKLKAETDRFAQEKKARNLLLDTQDPISADTTVGQFKRLECYEKVGGRINIYTYAVGTGENGEEDEYIELAARQLPYWHGKYPLVSFYVKRRPHSFWGQGIFEDTERLQSAFNDIFNHYMDNLNISLDGMIMKQEGEEYTYIVEPGGEFLYKNQKPEQFKFPEPNPSQFKVIMDFIESQVEEATISRYATGTPNSSTDKTSGTASGIMKLTEMAGDKIGFMKQSFANSLREIGRQWLSNNQQFTVAPFTLMGQKDNRPAPVTVTPQDLQGQFVLRINDASMEPPTKDQELQQFSAFVQQLQAMQQASFVQAQQTRWATKPMYLDFGMLARDFAFKMGQANFDKVMLQGDEVEQAMQNSQTPMIQPNERLNIDINELYGSEAAQLLERNGIQADPQRQTQVPQAEIQAQLDANAQTLDVQKTKLEGAKTQFDMAHQAAGLSQQVDGQQFDQAHKTAQFTQGAKQQEFDQKHAKQQVKK